MTSRERFRLTLSRQEPDRVPMAEICFWPETIERWRQEGLPEDQDPGSFLGLDPIQMVGADLSLRLPLESIDPLGHFRRMGLLPVGHIRRIQLVCFDPVLRDGRMQNCPLGYNRRFPAKLVCLEPAFDVGADRLALLRAAAVLHDGAKLPRHAVPEQIIAGRPVGCARGGGVVRCRRRPRLEILVGREGLRSTRRCSVRKPFLTAIS